MLKFPNGAIYGFARVMATTVLATAISNASPAQATVAAGAVDAGEVVLITSGWSTLTNRVAVAGAEAAGKVPLIGIDTTDLDEYPAGRGVGSLLIAGEFTDFSQQGDISTSGGDQQFWTGQFLEDRSGRQIQIPTTKNPKVYTLPLYYDPALPWYSAAKSVDRKKEPVILRCQLPDGDILYYYGYLSFDADPTLSMNNPMQNTMTFSAISEPTLVEAA